MGYGRKAWAACCAVTCIGAGVAIPAVAPAGAAAKSLTVTPHTGLHGGDTVRVRGTGFGSGGPVAALECVAPAATPDSCDRSNAQFTSTDAHGGFSVLVVVHRHVVTVGPSGASIVDCVVRKCVMLAAGQNFGDNATVALGFSTTGGPHSVVAASPATKLRDLQRIEVDGHGFGSGPLFVGECLASDVPLGCGQVTQVSYSGPGSFATSVPVRRLVSSASGQFVDCAQSKGKCVITAFDGTDLDYLATAPLAFDASVPPPPPPSATVTPDTKLPYYVHVRVRGAHWTPGDEIFVTECGDRALCLPGIGAGFGLAVGPDGGFDTTILATRMYVDPIGLTPSVDCVKHPACVIAVSDFETRATTFLPIRFDPSAPVPPKPTVALSPKGPYHDQQTVTVTGRHFPPVAGYSVGECVSSASSQGCLTEGAGSVTDATGAFAASFTVERSDPDFGFDCTAQGTTCTLVVQSEGGVEVDIPLTFVKGAASTTRFAHVHAVGFVRNMPAWARAARRGRARVLSTAGW